MKKLLAMLLTLLMMLSFVTVSFASEKVLTPAEAEIKAGSGVYVSGGGVGLSENGHIGFKDIDLTGIKSVKIEADCLMPYGSNGDTIAIRIDGPKTLPIGYVVINDEAKTEFYGNITATEGVHDLYLTPSYMRSGKCISVCKDAISADASGIKIDREKCTSCGECSKVCLGEALSLSQSEMTTDEIFSEIIADISYYKYSGGGVTFSGGECLRQPDALKDILLSCKKEGINTCIETCLDISWKTVSEIAEYTDSFFVDIKLMDRNKHKEYTNVGNARIIENITKLFKKHSDITFRIPLIPGVNDDMANLEQTVKFVSLLEGNGERRIEVLRYNNLAESANILFYERVRPIPTL